MRLTWIFSSGSTSPESHYQEQSHLNLVIRISLTWILFPSSGSASPESYSHHPDQPHLNLIPIIWISLTWISCIFSSSCGEIPSSISSVSRRFRRLPVSETVRRTGLMATAAAAVISAIPASGATSRASGLAPPAGTGNNVKFHTI